MKIKATNLHRWARLTHVYTSMIALAIVLFFGVTGLTLNHPTWAFGDHASEETFVGTLPTVELPDGSVDFLAAAEYVRGEFGVSGDVANYEASPTQASIGFKKPGYSADLLFDVTTGEFELSVNQQGFVAVMNDLHKGRDAGSGWRWLIDISAVFLVVISMSGLLMQFFLRKRRTSAFVVAGAGGILTIIAIILTVL